LSVSLCVFRAPLLCLQPPAQSSRFTWPDVARHLPPTSRHQCRRVRSGLRTARPRAHVRGIYSATRSRPTRACFVEGSAADAADMTLLNRVNRQPAPPPVSPQSISFHRQTTADWSVNLVLGKFWVPHDVIISFVPSRVQVQYRKSIDLPKLMVGTFAVVQYLTCQPRAVP
jgi:hypothetical protein